MARVSVVIPLYQTEAYIDAALRSVLAQTFTDFEVIVVDDGSRDRGPEIARSTGDPRVTVVSQENRGLAGARNTGIRVAQCPYIALLDADDVWDHRKLALHVEHLDSEPNVHVSFSASRLIDGSGGDLGLVQSPISRDFTAQAFFCRNPIGNGSVPVFRRSALDRIAFWDSARNRECWFDESFRQSEDIECWMRLRVKAGANFGYISEPLTLYRVNSGGLSANVAAQLQSWHRFRESVRSYAPDLVARYGHQAEAYQLRYLARRAIRSDDRIAGLTLVSRALGIYPKLLLEEPARTASTIAAALGKMALPAKAYARLEQAALGLAASNPGLRM